jgi:two-component system CheB/CheR fusion protein
MARPGLRFDLGIAFQKAVRQKGAIAVKGLKVGENDDSQRVDITVQAIEEPEALRGMAMIVFTDVPTPQKEKRATHSKTAPIANTQVLEMEQDLQHVRQELQMTREEMQSSQEELKSVNEELQSANEELQSTNEELTTSREEMQSLNEELQTVNAEQQSKMDELSRVNNDMKNLLNCTEIVTVFLDKKLLVRRFTSGADKLFKLSPAMWGDRSPTSSATCAIPTWPKTPGMCCGR